MGIKSEQKANQGTGVLLSSSKSMQISLQAVRNGKAGLDAHRQAILNRVPEQGDWARFGFETIELKDLAYLSAKTGDEFALLRGKKEDILFHGDSLNCHFTGLVGEMLLEHKLEIVGHAHPGEEVPIASANDRRALSRIGQTKSTVISAITGRCSDFGASPFEDVD